MLVFAAGLMVEGYTRGILGENTSTEPSPDGIRPSPRPR
jgi:hypothetical protein